MSRSALAERLGRPFDQQEIEWLGVSGYRLTYEGVSLFVDPYVSRVPLRALLLGRVATVGADGTPHVVPVGFSYDEEHDAIDEDDEVRFALTSEAGLNDGLAFPIVYAAIFLATTLLTGCTGWSPAAAPTPSTPRLPWARISMSSSVNTRSHERPTE